jgi:hypothetical protein
MNAWLRYLITFVVACHGLTYLLFPFFAPAGIKGWRGRSWLLGGAVTGDWFKALVTTLHVGAGSQLSPARSPSPSPPPRQGAQPREFRGVLRWAGPPRRRGGVISVAIGVLLARAIVFPRAFG